MGADPDVFAPAKINLTLHVTGQRADGYHLLDSLVVFADAGDRLWLEAAPRLALTITGPFANGVPADARNLVWQAAEIAGWTGHITLEKNLPHGAGVGGGSADAAAVLRYLIPDDAGQKAVHDAALTLGADVPVCLQTRPQRLRGIGGILDNVYPVPALHLVLVHPARALSTPEVFKALTQRANQSMTSLVEITDRAYFMAWLAAQRNDLQQAATALEPVIADVLAALNDAELARMSGSGTACFGIYTDARTARMAAARITRDHPAWWAVAAQTTGAGTG